jgi:CRP-like cAMP-binding protein
VGTLVRLRPGQRLIRPPEGSDTLLVARTGVFTSQAAWPGRRTSVLGLHYPGDVLPAGALPPQCESSIMAATTSEVLRLGAPALQARDGKDAALQQWVLRSLLAQQARLGVHTVIVTTLDAGERVASLFFELALRLGQRTGTGVALEVPLSRQTLADYLGLNADTLSRIVSKLKSKSILEQTARHRFVIRDWRALQELSPFNATLEALHDTRGKDVFHLGK